MSTGIIKFFDTTKGFGFIQPADGSSDVFVHATQLNPESFNEGETPVEGDTVSYEIVEGKKGPMAGNVCKAEGGASEEAMAMAA